MPYKKITILLNIFVLKLAGPMDKEWAGGEESSLKDRKC